jgi:NAD-dependent dihydropyrimidine dehydrogenase PreA subunit
MARSGGTPLEKQRRAAAHPQRPGERCAAPPATWTPVVDHGRCEAKADCVVVCPNDVFEVTAIGADEWAALGPLAKVRVAAHGRRSAYAVRAEECNACGLCVVACPEKAISLVPPPGGAPGR